MTKQENALARYTILRELGRGPLGTVWATSDRQTGAVVAMKTLDMALLGKSGPSVADPFVKRALSARRLQHRNIVQVLDAGEMAGAPYVTMEMVEGDSLRKLLGDGPPGIARALQIIHEVASALEYAHLEGMVHGSIRPSSIIVPRSGQAKVTDFGMGELAEAGAPNYLSPEQVLGEPVDHRCDLFSLGAVFYEILTGRRAFDGSSSQEVMHNILHKAPPPPSELNPLVPHALDAIVTRMLARQPADRMAGMPVLLRELERLQEGLGVRLGANSANDEPSARPRRSGPAQEPAPVMHADLMEREPWPEHSSGWRPAILAAVTLAVIASAIGGFMYYAAQSGEHAIAVAPVQKPEAPLAAAPAPAPAPAPEPLPNPVVAAAAAPSLPAPAVDEAPAEEKPPAAAPEKAPPRPARPAAKAPEPPRTATAQLVVAVTPGGEIYIDGKHEGTAPSTTTVDLEPGMHRIEVRSGSRRPFVTYMTVQAGDVRRIRHDFNAKPIRPPA